MEEQPESPPLYEERYKPCFLWTLILAPCFMPIVWQYHVVVTESELSIGYASGCSSLTIDRSQIKTVEVVPMIEPFCDWGGYGIRLQFPALEIGYIAKKGPGIRMSIERADGKEAFYTFCTEDPERVASLLTNC